MEGAKRGVSYAYTTPRAVSCTNGYPHCETHCKNDWHVFIGCVEARKIWRASGLWDKVSGSFSAATSFAKDNQGV
jgi:hypothetical protein